VQYDLILIQQKYINVDNHVSGILDIPPDFYWSYNDTSNTAIFDL